MQATNDRFLTTTQAARLIGVHPSTVTRRVQAGVLSAMTDPRDYRRRLIERSAIEKMMEPLQRGEGQARTTA